MATGLTPQIHGGAIYQGPCANPKAGPGRYPQTLRERAKARLEGETGKPYDEIVDEIAQGSQFEGMRLAAVRTQAELAQHNKPVIVELRNPEVLNKLIEVAQRLPEVHILAVVAAAVRAGQELGCEVGSEQERGRLSAVASEYLGEFEE